MPHFSKLDENIFSSILAYLHDVKDFIYLSSTTKWLRTMLLTNAIWKFKSIDLCLVGNCSGCGRCKISSTALSHVLSIIPIQYSCLHIPYDKLPESMTLFTKTQILKRLNIRCTNSPCSDEIKRRSSNDQASRNLEYDFDEIIRQFQLVPTLQSLEELIIVGWPVSRMIDHSIMRIPSFDSFLRIVGSNLKMITMSEIVPFDFFECMALYCSQIEEINIDGRVYSSIFALDKLSPIDKTTKIRKNDLKLQRLSITNTQLLLTSNLQSFPLVKFEYLISASFFRFAFDNHASYSKILNALPTSIQDLSLNIEYVKCNTFLQTIGTLLPNLLHLKVQLEDFAGTAIDPLVLHRSTAHSQEVHDASMHENWIAQNMIQYTTIVQLVKTCPHLYSFELYGYPLLFSSKALLLFGDLKYLERLTVPFPFPLVSQQTLPSTIAYGKAFWSELYQMIDCCETLRTLTIHSREFQRFRPLADELLQSWNNELNEEVTLIAERFPMVEIKFGQFFWSS